MILIPILGYFGLFQFQYGAIKSCYAIAGNQTLSLFQFQYGAIKRP